VKTRALCADERCAHGRCVWHSALRGGDGRVGRVAVAARCRAHSRACDRGAASRAVLLSLAEQIDGAVVVLLRRVQRDCALLQYEIIVLPQTLQQGAEPQSRSSARHGRQPLLATLAEELITQRALAVGTPSLNPIARGMVGTARTSLISSRMSCTVKSSSIRTDPSSDFSPLLFSSL